MAIAGISPSIVVTANDAQAQTGDAQSNPLATLQIRTAASQTQLSAFGRVKSSLSDLQAKAQALINFSKPPTLNDFKTVVQGFIQSFNELNKTVTEVSSLKQSILSNDSRPGQALSEVRKAMLGSANASTSLQKYGIDRQSDGGFSINQKTLAQAFQDNRDGTLGSFAGVADRVGKTIDKQLSLNGTIGRKVQDLSIQTRSLENTRNSAMEHLDTQKNFQQRLAAQLAGAGGYVARNAVVAYFNIASL